MIDDGFFQINDIILDIPPTEIRITKNAFDQRLNNLRTVGASVIRSKFSTLSIHMSVVFTEEKGGYNNLRDLVSQLRLTPFCYVKNRFLAESIFGNPEKSEMVLALDNMTLTMSGGDTVNAIKVLFIFSYFNHKAYVGKFEYKRHLFGPNSNDVVSDPKDSEAWKLFYQAEQKRRNYKKTPVFTDYNKTGGQIIDTNMSYFKYSLFTAAEIRGRLDEAVAVESVATADYYSQSATETGNDAYLSTNIAAQMGVWYPQALSLKEQTEMLKDDVGTSMLTAKDLNLSPAQIIANSPRHEFFNEINGWKAVNLKDGSLAKFSVIDEKTPRQAAKETRGQDLVVCYKKQSLSLKKEGIVPIGVSISFSNRLAPIPLLGSPYPTFQYLGGADATVSMSFLTTSNAALENISNFHSIWKEQRELMRNIPTSLRRVSISNDLLNMCGLHEFHLQGIEISTVPGQPETKQINFDLIENAKPDFSDEQLTYERIKPGLSLAESGSDVFTFLFNNIRTEAIATNSIWGANAHFSSPGGYVSLKNWETQFRKHLITKKQIFKSEDGHIRHGSYSRHTWHARTSEIEDGPFLMTGDRDGPLPLEGRSGETGEIKEDIVLFPLNLQKGLYANSAIFDLLTEFNIVFSEFVINLLKYIQGRKVQEATANTVAYTAGGGIRTRGGITHNPLAFKRTQEILRASKEGGVLGLPNAHAIAKTIIINNTTKQGKQSDWELQETTKAKFSEKYKDQIQDLKFEEHEFVMKYNVKIISLINKVLQSPIFMNLPELAFLKKARKDSIENLGFNTYPDFPMSELLSVIKEDGGGEEFLKSLRTSLSELNDLYTSGNKYINVNTFFGPDFYLASGAGYNDTALDRSRLRDASNQILSVYSGKGPGSRHDAVNAWLKKGLENSSRAVQQRKILAEVTSRFPDNPAVQYVPPSGNENKGLKNTGTAQQSNLVNNPISASGALSAGSHSLTELTSEQRKQMGIPVFTWPTNSQWKITTPFQEDTYNKQGRIHKALDIASGNKNIPTNTMPVFAVAKGTITKMTYITEYSSRKYSDTDSRFKTDKLIDKKIPQMLGKVANQGNAITIKHEGGWVSKYFHLQDDDLFRQLINKYLDAKDVNQKLEVPMGGVLGTIGSTGRSTGPHLHFELLFKGKAQDPQAVIEKGMFRTKAFNTDSFMSTNGALEKAHDKFKSSLIAHRSMLRAYPTYKLFFVESDYGERHFFGMDDLFSYQAVQDIQIIKSANNPADLMVVRISNLGGYLTNRRFKDIRQDQNKKGDVPFQVSPISPTSKNEESVRSAENPVDMFKRDSIEENPLESLFMKVGMQVQMRMGFNPNPSELDIVFDGLVMDIQFHNTDEVITLTCQSFGMELAAGVLGMSTLEDEDDKEKFTEFKGERGKTNQIVSQLLKHPTLKHFGRWEAGNTLSGSSGIKWDPWSLVEKITDDNVFIPEIANNVPDEETRKILLKQHAVQGTFKAYRTTIWDSIQQLTLRHPGYIAYPISYEGSYGPRSTLYFGLPSGQYLSRDATWDEDQVMNTVEKLARRTSKDLSLNSHDVKTYKEQYKEQQKLITKLNTALGTDDVDDRKEALDFSVANTIKNFAEKRGIIKSFRSYHMISNEVNLIANNVISSAYSTFNAATVEYQFKEKENEDGDPIFGEPKTLSVKADPGIPDEEIREVYAGDENCISQNMAKNYAQAILWKSMKKGYRGSFTISGNAEIKPYDICYVHDTYTDMYGPVEVEQVVHRFSYETGFVTEIVPMMCIQTNETSSMATVDVLSVMAEEWMMGLILEVGKMVTDHEFIGTVGIMLGGVALLAVGVKIAAIAMGAMALGTAFVAVSSVALFVQAAAIAIMTGGAIYGISGLFDDDNKSESGSYIQDFGLFFTEKFITRTQMAQLFEYSPLMVRGRPLLGGLPTRTQSPGTFSQRVTKEGIKWWHEGKGARRVMNVEQSIINNPANYPGLSDVLGRENRITEEED